ncbi:hypothetical protein J6590_033389 [Homalodisca vitripennis]|nr:hypothetical protein J6590_043830 [Homalodisca vitripennis]KAG8277858.1 hypothetical protein J6590_033389 [Homalodisca vitripennis]
MSDIVKKIINSTIDLDDLQNISGGPSMILGPGPRYYLCNNHRQTDERGKSLLVRPNDDQPER